MSTCNIKYTASKVDARIILKKVLKTDQKIMLSGAKTPLNITYLQGLVNINKDDTNLNFDEVISGFVDLFKGPGSYFNKPVQSNEDLTKQIGFIFEILQTYLPEKESLSTKFKEQFTKKFTEWEESKKPKQEKSDTDDDSELETEIEGTIDQIANKKVLTKALNVFKQDGIVNSLISNFTFKIINHSYVNLEARDKDGKLVGKIIDQNKKSLNQSLNDFKNELWETVVKYLDDNGINFANGYLYSNEGKQVLNPDYISIMNKAAEYINNNSNHSDDVQLGWRELLSEQLSQRIIQNKDKQHYYQFVEAWFTLQYFDDLMKLNFPGVKIKKSLLNTMPMYKAHAKYTVTLDKRSRNKGWTDDDKRNGFTEAGKESTNLLESLLLKSYKRFLDGESKYDRKGLTINLIRTTRVFNKLLELIYNNKLTSDATQKESALFKIINALLSLHLSPKQNIKIILDNLFLGEKPAITKLRNENDLTENEVDTLFSLWINVFNTIRPTDDNGYGISIMMLENDRQSHNFSNSLYSDGIVGLIDRVTELKYLSVSYEPSTGQLQLNYRNKFKDTGMLHLICEDVNRHMLVEMSDDDHKKLNDKFNFIPIEDNDNPDLKNAWKIEWKNSDLKIIVKPNLKSEGGVHNILDPIENTIFIQKGDGEEILIDKYFKQITFNRNDIDEIDNENSDINKVLTLFKDTLGIDFFSDASLTQLYLYKLDSNKMFHNLAVGAIKGLAVNKALAEYDPESNQDLKYFMVNNYPNWFKGPLGTIENGKFVVTEKSALIKVIGDDYDLQSSSTQDNWIEDWSEMHLLFLGEKPKSTSKNFQGNSEQNGRTSFLAAQLQSQITKIVNEKKRYDELNEDKNYDILHESKIAASNLLFVKHRKLLKGIIMSSDIKSRKERIKSIKNLKTAELLHTHIFHDFWGMLTSQKIKGKVAIQPTTYSDKGSITSNIIDATYKFKDETSFDDLSFNKTVDLLMETAGNFYQDILFNVILLFNKILKPKEDFKSLLEVDNYLRNEYKGDEYDLSKEASKLGITIRRDLHFVVDNGRLGINPLLDFYANNLYTNADMLKARLRLEQLNFVNSIINSNACFLTVNDEIDSALKYVLKNKIDQERWTRNNCLVIAIIKDKYGKERKIVQGTPILLEDGESFEMNPIFEKFFNAQTVAGLNLRLLETGSDLGHPIEKAQAFKKKSEFILQLNNILGTDFSVNDSFIEIKNAIYSSGDSNAINLYNDLIIEMQGINNNGTEGTQLKRNVIIPATLQNVQQNALNGVSKKIKVAMIDDIKAYVNTLNGINDKVDSQDGGGFQLGWHTILINRALLDQAVGIDMKPIWHYYDPITGTATLVKYAIYTMTNLRMLLSLNSDLKLYNLFKKMSNIRWSRNRDKISEGYKIDLIYGKHYGHDSDFKQSTKISFLNDILNGHDLIYGFGNEYRKITNLNKNSNGDYFTVETLLTPDNQEGASARVYHLFDTLSNHVKCNEEQYNELKKTGKYHTIDSLFELHCALGGVLCCDYNEKTKRFVSSETNNECIANYMNIIGCYWKEGNAKPNTEVNLTDDVRLKGKDNPNFQYVEYINQSNYFQPLKDMYIGCALNNTNVKSAPGNVNRKEAWTNDEELSYTELDSDGFGIQQDSDHIADEAELTEPSQVMTALDQGGDLHEYAKQIYTALGKTTLAAAKVELSTIDDFERKLKNKKNENPVNDLYDIVGRIILKNLDSRDSNMDLSLEILRVIEKDFNIKSYDHIKDKLKIACSDANIYGHILPAIISTLNSKGIRRKNPGSGEIMVPSYGWAQVFKIGNENVTYSELARRVSKNRNRSEITTNEKGIGSFNEDSLTANGINQLVNNYLNELQQIQNAKQENKLFADFDLGDVVNVHGILLTSKVQIDEIEKIPWKENDKKFNKAWKFYIKGDDTRHILIKEDNENGDINNPNGYYSIHFRTGTYNPESGRVENKISPKDLTLLLKTARLFLKDREGFKGLYTHGSVTKGGINAISRLSSYYGMIPDSKNSILIVLPNLTSLITSKALDEINNYQTVKLQCDTEISKLNQELKNNPSKLKEIENKIKEQRDASKKAKQKILAKVRDERNYYSLRNLIEIDYDETKNVVTGKLAALKFPENDADHVELVINSEPKLFYLKLKNWYKFSDNFNGLKKAYNVLNNTNIDDATLELKLKEVGVADIINTLRAQALLNNNESFNSILFLASHDQYLKLYDYEDFEYFENVTRGRDLAPSRIKFDEVIDGITRHRSFYDIPVIQKAFRTGNLNSKFIQKALFRDLKHGFYYDNYEEFTNPEGYIDVRRSGIQHQITNLKYLKPQCISSNLVANRFGGTYDMTLLEFLENILFDSKKFKENLDKDYIIPKAQLRFIKGNYLHTYITFNEVDVKEENKSGDFTYSKTLFDYRSSKEIINDRIVFKKMLLGKNSLDLYEIGRLIEMPEYTIKNGNIYDKDNKLVNDKQFKVIEVDGQQKVFKQFNFINRYSVYCKENDTTYSLFSINKKQIEEISSLTGDKDILENSLADIYKQDTYIAFDENKKKELEDRNIVKNISKIDSDLSEYVKDFINKKEDITPILNKFEKEIKTSFELSKYVIASRIPAQTLQSFMPMEIVGYSQMEQGVVYVSAIQTFLQGSDYDIDKSYIITHFFDDNGRFIKWSPLVSLNSIEEAQASTKIGIPLNNMKLVKQSDVENNVSSEEIRNLRSKKKLTSEEQEQLNSLKESYYKNLKSIDITNELLNIINAQNNNDKIAELNAYAELINKVDNNYIEAKYKQGKEDKLIFIYDYDPSLNKNVVDKIIQQVENHENYEVPENISEKGFQNANSIKIQLIIQAWENLDSANTPIAMDVPRSAAKNSRNNKRGQTLLNPAVIYEMQVENQVGKKTIGIAANGEKAFFTLYYYFTECYKKLKDVADKVGSDKVLNEMINFKQTFDRILGRSKGTPTSVTKEQIANLNRFICGKGDNLRFEVDLMISQLLSAATDNAKELILAKINSNDTFAKIYFYGLLVGFSIDDIAAFMTSPAINTLVKLSEQNMFDAYIDNIQADDVYKMLVYGNFQWEDFLSDKIARAYNSILKQSNPTIRLNDGTEVKIQSLNEWGKLKIDGKIDQTFYDFVYDYINGGSLDREGEYTYQVLDWTKPALQCLTEYIEGTSQKVKLERKDPENFELDLEEFKKLWDLSNEITTLTNTYLNTNQGLPTTLDKYTTKLVNILKTVRDREDTFTTYESNGKIKDSFLNILDDTNLKTKEDKAERLYQLITKNNNNAFLNKNEVISTLIEALDENMVRKFSYERWMTDQNYRDLTVRYYNLIKGTVNIFHFLEIHPLFNANMKLFRCSYPMIKYTSLKSKLILATQQEYLKNTNFWQAKLNKDLSLSIDKVIIKYFLKNNIITIKTPDTVELLNSAWKPSKLHEELLVLDNGYDISNFKYLFEKYIVPKLKNGDYKGIKGNTEISLKDNKLIKDIILKTSFNRPYYGLNINLNEIDVSAMTNLQYIDLVNGLAELSDYKIPEISDTLSIQDLFILYNLLENRNRYGSDKLTGLLKDVLNKNNKHDSLLHKYLEYIGELDYNSYKIDEKDILPMLEDIKIDMAPTTSEYALNYHKEPYVWVRKNGLKLLYHKTEETGDYELVSMIRNEFDENIAKPTNEQLKNFMMYNTLFSFNADKNNVIISRLRSKNFEIVFDQIQKLIGSNKMIITYKC